MPKCTIDGVEVEFSPGENLVKVAKRAGVEIPVFCYHPGLSVVAQCRMCYVEVEKMPKLQTACSTSPTDGMVVKTQSEAVKKGRAGTMEFLLLNHPLDCPICDKSGDCDLQDNSYGHGSQYMRHSEERRTYVDIDMGPVIQKNMNRCIHCTRCIRFGDEIAGIHEMVAIQRGNNIDITTIDGKQLQTEYAGNYSDVCPTGSLTLKDFRFQKRAWMLKHTASTCEGCSKGCSNEIHHEGNVVYRTIGRENLAVNKYWLCDEGRFNFNYTQDESRVLFPESRTGNISTASSWDETILGVKDELAGKSPLFLVGTDLTQEELSLIKEFAGKHYPKSNVLSFGTVGVPTTKEDGSLDGILKMKSKTSNVNGAEKLGIEALQKGNESLIANADTVIIFRGGRAQLPAALVGANTHKNPAKKNIYGVGVFLKTDLEDIAFTRILPGLAFTEKNGTIINHAGLEQELKRAVTPRGKCKSIAEVLMLLMNAKAKAGAA
jgi:NADH-quinone oxidoreductase subunit G